MIILHDRYALLDNRCKDDGLKRGILEVSIHWVHNAVLALAEKEAKLKAESSASGKIAKLIHRANVALGSSDEDDSDMEGAEEHVSLSYFYLRQKVT